MLTLLLGLGGSHSGGATCFPRLDFEVCLEAGELLRFNNADADQQPLAASLHCGTPVKAGEKWLLSKWVREGPTPYGRETRAVL